MGQDILYVTRKPRDFRVRILNGQEDVSSWNRKSFWDGLDPDGKFFWVVVSKICPSFFVESTAKWEVGLRQFPCCCHLHVCHKPTRAKQVFPDDGLQAEQWG